MRFTVVSLSALLALAGWSCTEEEAKNEITLGLIVPITGSLATVGAGIENATLLAQKEINDAGGVLGKELVFESRDSRTTPEASKEAAEALVGLGVPVILGAAGSSNTLAVLEVTVPAKVLTINGSSTSTAFTTYADDGYFFRTVPSVAVLSRVLADYAYNDKSNRTVGILVTGNSYTETLAETLTAEFGALGGAVTKEVAYMSEPPVDYNYGGDLAEVYAGSPDAIFLAGYPEDGVRFLNTWAQDAAEFQGDWYLADSMRDAKVPDTIGAAAAEGISGTSFAAPGGPAHDGFVAAYKETYGEDPGVRTRENYDAMYLVALAIAKAGKADADAIRVALPEVAGPPGTPVGPHELERALELIEAGEEIDYTGAGGPVDFDAVGDVAAPVEIWAFQSGATVRIDVR